MGLLPQAALQNRALLALKPQVGAAAASWRASWPAVVGGGWGVGVASASVMPAQAQHAVLRAPASLCLHCLTRARPVASCPGCCTSHMHARCSQPAPASSPRGAACRRRRITTPLSCWTLTWCPWTSGSWSTGRRGGSAPCARWGPARRWCCPPSSSRRRAWRLRPSAGRRWRWAPCGRRSRW